MYLRERQPGGAAGGRGTGGEATTWPREADGDEGDEGDEDVAVVSSVEEPQSAERRNGVWAWRESRRGGREANDLYEEREREGGRCLRGRGLRFTFPIELKI